MTGKDRQLDEKKFTTRSADVATWLVYRKHWCSVVVDDAHRSVFVFTDSPELHQDVAAFGTATASALGLMKAGNILRKKARRAALRHRDWERRVANTAGPFQAGSMFERMLSTRMQQGEDGAR
jgi:hypothetical protein